MLSKEDRDELKDPLMRQLMIKLFCLNGTLADRPPTKLSSGLRRQIKAVEEEISMRRKLRETLDKFK